MPSVIVVVTWRHYQRDNPNEASADERLLEVTRRLSRARTHLRNSLYELLEAYEVLRNHKSPEIKFEIVKEILHVALVMDVNDVARMIIADNSRSFSLRRRKYIADRVPGLPAALQRQEECRMN